MNHDPRILIVDDEPVVREICQRTLASISGQVHTAANGEEAISLIRSGDYDLVLTDLVMPGALKAGEFLTEIKRRSPRTDVIVMTGYPTLDTAIPALKAGAFDYLVKPLEQDVLRSTVKRCFDMRRLSGELDRGERLSQELQAAYGQLQDMERLKESFISRVNHELRSPMTPLFMVMHELKRMETTTKGRDLCGVMEERLNKLQDVVQSVLLFSDVQHGASGYPKKTLNVRDLMASVVERYRPLWQEKELDVQTTWDPDIEILTGIPSLLETAFKNLFLNAIEFNRKKGHIEIKAKRLGIEAEISIADTGIGIPTSKLSHVFDSFYQVADYLTREVGGIGLGLALTRRIVELHAGSIRAESREGEGTVFTVVLPAH